MAMPMHSQLSLLRSIRAKSGNLSKYFWLRARPGPLLKGLLKEVPIHQRIVLEDFFLDEVEE